MDNNCAVELRHITKRFGKVVANDSIDLTINRGEILSLLGENGSGKTTLMNMLAGIYFPDEGEIYVNGVLTSIRSPKDAFDNHIGMIHQHYKLVDVFTAAENIVLGLDEPDWLDPAALGAGTNWLDEMLQTGIMQNYSVSYSGGSEKAHYYVSGGFLDQSGTVRNVGYRRFTFQSNSDAQVLNWLKFTTNITFSADSKNSGEYSIGSIMGALPVIGIKDEDGEWAGPEGNSEWYGSTRNPVGVNETNKSKTNGSNLSKLVFISL